MLSIALPGDRAAPRRGLPDAPARLHVQRERETDRERETERERETDRQRERERERETETERMSACVCSCVHVWGAVHTKLPPLCHELHGAEVWARPRRVIAGI